MKALWRSFWYSATVALYAAMATFMACLSATVAMILSGRHGWPAVISVWPALLAVGLAMWRFPDGPRE